MPATASVACHFRPAYHRRCRSQKRRQRTGCRSTARSRRRCPHRLAHAAARFIEVTPTMKPKIVIAVASDTPIIPTCGAARSGPRPEARPGTRRTATRQRTRCREHDDGVATAIPRQRQEKGRSKAKESRRPRRPGPCENKKIAQATQLRRARDGHRSSWSWDLSLAKPHKVHDLRISHRDILRI